MLLRAHACRRPLLAWVLLMLVASPRLSWGGSHGAFERTEDRPRCADYDPHRSPFFGDLHVHTSFSMDSVFIGNLVNDPRAAYRFAKGEPLGLPPFDGAGNPAVVVQLRRPLDFAAVTDHAEYLGEVEICQTPEHPGYDSPECQLLRSPVPFAPFPSWFAPLIQVTPPSPPPERFDFCGDGGDDCLEVAATMWEETRAAAAEAYDAAPACGFTSFVGYEWTYTPGGAHLHRNVLFRNAEVPELPISFLDAATKEGLWDGLESTCLDAPGACDVLAIPHNPNISAGGAFVPETSEGVPVTATEAARRAALEPLVEIIQHKGASECRFGLGANDELCSFELMSTPIFGAPPGTPMPPFEPLSFVRNALKEGLLEEQRTGVNPFRLGFVGGTDTHGGTAGATREDDFQGHFGAADSSLRGRLSAPWLEANPGGLTVIWAEENSRDALFAALRRREVYATSGTRPIVRFFGSFLFPGNLCDSPAFVQRGYAQGVPMGGELDGPPGLVRKRSPRFAVSALRDAGVAGSPGTQLQRLQVVKGWVEEGEAHEAVYDVAGDALNGAGVDPATGEPTGPGYDSLCTVWTDPDFDPDQPAFYYARVLENPTLRWSARQCRAAGVDCALPSSVPEGFEGCCDPGIQETIQERAWTSPIWFSPRD